jgi:hypothetical protein
MKKYIYLFVILTIGFSSCETEEPVKFKLDLTHKLVLRYDFDNNTDDNSKNSNSFSFVNGGKFISDRFNKSNSAIELDGSFDYLRTLNISPSLNPSEFSISLWLKLPSQYNYSTLAFVKNGSSTNDGFIFGMDQNNNAIGINNYWVFFKIGGAADVGFLTNQNELGNWVNLVSVYDGQKLKIYINSVLKSEKANVKNIIFNNNDLIFGLWDNPSKPIMKRRMIDNLKIWNRSLSEDEIREIYNN